MSNFCGVTGYVAQHLPAGEQTDDVMRVLRLGAAFDRTGGRERGCLFNHVAQLVAQISGKPTFERLLVKMEVEVLRHDENSPVVRVSRTSRHVTYRDHDGGIQEISLGALRNVLTEAKKHFSCVPKQ